jgi:hypothetical protein
MQPQRKSAEDSSTQPTRVAEAPARELVERLIVVTTAKTTAIANAMDNAAKTKRVAIITHSFNKACAGSLGAGRSVGQRN